MKILVIGDKGTDIFSYGECNRICPEAPVPVFTPVYQTENEGMAGNLYRNLLGLLSKKDSITLLSNPEAITKTRLVDLKSNQMLVRVDTDDSCRRVSKQDLDNALASEWDAVVVSDYNKGFLLEEDIEYILEKSKLTFIDTKKQIGDWIIKADFIKINSTEYSTNQKAFLELENRLTGELIVTLGGEGVKWRDSIIKPKSKIQALDVSGAGDTFLAGLVYRYLESRSIEQALVYANSCAQEIVQQKGVGTLN